YRPEIKLEEIDALIAAWPPIKDEKDRLEFLQTVDFLQNLSPKMLVHELQNCVPRTKPGPRAPSEEELIELWERAEDLGKDIASIIHLHEGSRRNIPIEDWIAKAIDKKPSHNHELLAEKCDLLKSWATDKT